MERTRITGEEAGLFQLLYLRDFTLEPWNNTSRDKYVFRNSLPRHTLIKLRRDCVSTCYDKFALRERALVILLINLVGTSATSAGLDEDNISDYPPRIKTLVD